MKTKHFDVEKVTAGMSEPHALHVLNLVENCTHALSNAHEATQARAQLLRDLKRFAENGKVIYLESGMDCDCVKYSGKKHLIDATPQALDELYDYINKWADGPFDLSGPYQPSVTENWKYESRDLALEAFEDGHPHVVYA